MCIDVLVGNLGAVSGVLDLPLRAIVMSWTLDPGERPAVASALLAAAGITQRSEDEPTCICGEPLVMDDRPSMTG
jgi:hypothetical protein